MIQQIFINNFQSHKETKLDLSDGVNIIVGSSDNGKSAILRALFWLIENRPQGIAFASNWIKDEKGKLNDQVNVSLSLEDLVVSRVRTQVNNHYVQLFNEKGIEPNVFEKVSGDVPDEIKSLLNITDVNIQRQFDAHFLLSSSSGEIARFLNSIAKLDLIDIMISAVESKRRQTNKEIKNKKGEIIDIKNQLESYNWIEEAELYIEKMEKQKDKIKDKESKRMSISTFVCDYTSNHKKIQDANCIIKADSLIDKYIKEKQAITEIAEEKDEIKYSLSDIIDNESIIEKSDKILSAESVVNKFIEEDNKLASIKAKKDIIDEMLDDIFLFEDSVVACAKKIKQLEEELPELCPVCGGKL